MKAISMLAVDPADFAATFGPGYALRRITVQITDDPVTTGIEQKLPNDLWRRWAAYNQSQMSRKRGMMKNPCFQPLPGSISKNDFMSWRNR